MFDVGFTELLVIAVVALIVIGPERLPKVARTAGAWLGRLNRFVSQVKQDIERDVQLEELRRLQRQMQEKAQRFEIVADETSETIRKEVDQVSKVVQAMSITDGGLAAQELGRMQAEQADEGGHAAQTPHRSEEEKRPGEPSS